MFLRMKKIKSYSFLLFLVILFFALSFPGAAEQESSGKNPLFIQGYRMVDALNEEGNRSTEIELFFSKNVVNMMIHDNNKKCFSLFNEDEEIIPIEIQMADDQIDREKRNIIKIIAQKPLEPAKAYKMIISPELESKSGIKLGKQIEINFVTVDIAK